LSNDVTAELRDHPVTLLARSFARAKVWTEPTFRLFVLSADTSWLCKDWSALRLFLAYSISVLPMNL
jgi:hypothetical protein